MIKDWDLVIIFDELVMKKIDAWRDIVFKWIENMVNSHCVRLEFERGGGGGAHARLKLSLLYFIVWSYDEDGKTKGADAKAFRKHGLDNLLGSLHFSQCITHVVPAFTSLHYAGVHKYDSSP
ncbi:hypothetical protein B0H13DRAFT_1900206 [Mycena leptocephala]|nr:hypothetical protein B0H13DRAFT_1900206 [Mycena leptocephala]